MAKYEKKIYDFVNRLRRHHDHLRCLDENYNYMRKRQTYERMKDPEFCCDLEQMDKLGNSYFTSLIVKISDRQGKSFFERVNEPYKRLEKLVHKFHRDAKVESFSDSAHITFKSLADFIEQSEAELRTYMAIVRPIVHKWIKLMGKDTKFIGVGLFTNLHVAKGL